MIAIEYRKSIPRYLALRALGRRIPALYTGAISPVSLRQVPEPRLPTPSWVKVRPILSGVCGSDLATLCAKGSPYLSPLTSTPFVLGHEVVGRVTEVGAEAGGVAVGQRVVLQPALGCAVRGIEPPCDACGAGQTALCRNVTRGDISAGIQTGYCRDTGGAWSESFVAHASQVFRIADSLDDQVAVLTEPFACAVHAALRCLPGSDQTALVMGCGSIGLLTIAALRFLGSEARIVAVGKYAHQREHAARLGATDVLPFHRETKHRYEQLSGALGAELHQPEIGKPTVVGGAEVTFDCVASSVSIDDCFRLTAAGGHMVLVGMPSVPAGIDWTAIWYKELTLHAAYAYGRECHAGRERSTFELALELIARRGEELRPLVGSPFELRDYRTALRTALRTGEAKSIKTVFGISPS